MTIATEPAPLSYDGDDATVDFPITWKYFAKSHVVATLRDANGVETLWVLDTDYTLTAADVESGGTLTATTAPATGETLVIDLDPPNTQESSLPLGGPFPSPDVEDGLDLTAQRDAKIEAILSRAMLVPKTDTHTGSLLDLPIDSDRAGKFLGFAGDGKPTAVSADTTTAVDLSDRTVLAAGSTTARPLGDRWADVINVKDHGAKGDDATEETTAFQAAHTAVPSTGGIIYVPSGTYLLNSQDAADQFKVTKSNVTVAGNGASSVLKYSLTGDVTGVQCVVNIATVGSDVENVVVRDLLIDLPSDNDGTVIPTTSKKRGLLIQPDTSGGNIRDVLIERVIVQGSEADGFIMSGATGGLFCERAKFSNCLARDCRASGFVDFGGGDNKEITVENCWAVDCDGIGIEMSTAQGLTITDNILVRCAKGGIAPSFNATAGNSDSHQVLIADNYITETGLATNYPDAPGIEFTEAPNKFNTKVSGNVIQRCEGHGIKVNGTSFNIRITDNVIWDVGGGGTDTDGINLAGTNTGLQILNNVIRTESAGFTMDTGISVAGAGSVTNRIKGNTIIGETSARISANSPTQVFDELPPVADFTQNGNVGVGEDDLTTYSIPANTLHTNDMGVHVVAWGQTAANANNKTVILYFGGSVILTTGAVAANNKDWRIEAYIWRVNSTVARTIAWGDFNGAVIQSNTQRGIGGKDFTAATVVKCTGEATADDDITQGGLLISYVGQPSNA